MAVVLTTFMFNKISKISMKSKLFFVMKLGRLKRTLEVIVDHCSLWKVDKGNSTYARRKEFKNISNF